MARARLSSTGTDQGGTETYSTHSGGLSLGSMGHAKGGGKVSMEQKDELENEHFKLIKKKPWRRVLCRKNVAHAGLLPK